MFVSLDILIFCLSLLHRRLSLTIISKTWAEKVGTILNGSANLIYSVFITGSSFMCLYTQILPYFGDVQLDE